MMTRRDPDFHTAVTKWSTDRGDGDSLLRPWREAAGGGLVYVNRCGDVMEVTMPVDSNVIKQALVMMTDTEYRISTVASVKADKEGLGFTLTDTDGWALYAANHNSLLLPVPGELVRYYGRGIGFPVRGVATGRHIYYYETAADHAARREREEARAAFERAEQWLAGLAEFKARVDKLPEPFRDRIAGFMQRPEWGPGFGGYELFACEEAVKIADALRTDDAIRVYRKAGCDRQRELVPGVAYEEHSGNTFGAACTLAQLYVGNATLVPMMHGALCPLVGCRNYGCWCTRQPKEVA